MNSRRQRLLALGALSAGAVILLAGCASPSEPSGPAPATTTSAQPTTSGSGADEAARLAAEQSAAAEGSRLAQEADRVAAEQEAARVAAEEAARVEAEHAAAEQAAADQAAIEEAEREAAEQAAAEEAERQAAEEQAAAEQAAAEHAEQETADAAANGWYDSRGWVSPETAQRALAVGIEPGGDVPGYLRCGTICGEDPTSGEVQSWNQGFEPVPPGYESWLAPNATPYTIDSAGK